MEGQSGYGLLLLLLLLLAGACADCCHLWGGGSAVRLACLLGVLLFLLLLPLLRGSLCGSAHGSGWRLLHTRAAKGRQGCCAASELCERVRLRAAAGRRGRALLVEGRHPAGGAQAAAVSGGVLATPAERRIRQRISTNAKLPL